ncbi:DUF4062 domain-containing protein [Pseudoalteromonas sp. L23]|uniref:DUF4062 domain-containing protein n=1 Tax=unclassified Pseudoalteromonas TaxID=194690 RepID=UPI001EEFBFCA|nr:MULTISPECIES: DUF4062 domain-containing protein [unclassified Pseudoalteromonas]MCF7515952.1 DUF4062 domain-containing protein [Pseudoalteromonas sp. L7]MCF7528076.1 DUF4062 domain-containing protein [Pseudoalteromonas sp. L23]
MAKPQVFVSSTYYDLKHIRASLEGFIENLGYTAILSDKGRIAYDPDIPLDESCYRSASESEIFVLIVGGRYGSPASDEKVVATQEFHERYESVTKKEFQAARSNDIPTYILVEKSVYGEYETFRKNRKNTSVEYAHVDSVNVFLFLDEIMSKRRNNPLHQFEKHTDIEFWLKEQWAGLFRELLDKRNTNKKLVSLSDKVELLSEINSSLQTYLEEVIRAVKPDDGNAIIQAEHTKLSESQLKKKFLDIRFFSRLIDDLNVEYDEVVELIETAKNVKDFADKLEEKSDLVVSDLYEYWRKQNVTSIITELNSARSLLGKPAFPESFL